MTKFIVNNRTDALQTDINLFFYDNKLSNCPLSFADLLHEFQILMSVRILTIKISQWARENFCSYRKKGVWLRKDIKGFLFTLRWHNFKPQQSPAISDLRLRKTRSGKLQNYRVRFRKAPFSKCCPSTLTRKADSFLIHPVRRAFLKSFDFVTDQCGRWA